MRNHFRRSWTRAAERAARVECRRLREARIDELLAEMQHLARGEYAPRDLTPRPETPSPGKSQRLGL